jgi:hypothetical protein
MSDEHTVAGCESVYAHTQPGDIGGEIPVEIRKKWLDADIRALKVGHY